MKVWVVWYNDNIYEDEDPRVVILGIYKSDEKAKKIAHERNSKIQSCARYFVEHFEVLE